MPENVPPKETAAADGLDPNEQAPGVPRGSILGPAADVPEGQPGSVDPELKEDAAQAWVPPEGDQTSHEQGKK